MLIYGDLVSWYRLIDPPADHEEDAASYLEALERAASPPAETLLELGAGAGHNAFFLKQRFRCTLTDVSDEMQALSRELNQDCEHILGDMRTLRLGRLFDAVMIHDAVMYMTTREDLRAAIETAFAHTRPGSAALFAPDCVRETFQEHSSLLGVQDGTRGLRGVEWAWDPNPADDTFVVDYGLLLRDGDAVTSAHDRHLEGLFARTTWLRILQDAGYRVEVVSRPLGDGNVDGIFLCRRDP